MADMASPMEVTEYIITQQAETRIKIIVLLWSWWSEKNRREGEGKHDAAIIVHSSQIYAMEVSQLGSDTQHFKIRNQRRWTRPDVGVIKINCDAFFSVQNNEGGWGYVGRDSDGDVVMAAKGCLDHVMNLFHAELVACLQGVQAAVELGAARVIIETDALTVRQAVQTNDYELDSVGELVAELKEALRLNFNAYNVTFSLRGCKRVAHALAAWGCESSVEDSPVVDVLPDCIRFLVADDIAAHE